MYNTNVLILCLVFVFCFKPFHCLKKFSSEFSIEVDNRITAKNVSIDYGFKFFGHILNQHYRLRHMALPKTSVRKNKYLNEMLALDSRVISFRQLPVLKRSLHDLLNDPKWPEMWHLNNDAGLDMNMNVLNAWKSGYTGKGVVVTIMDDGMEKDHPDLAKNFDQMASFDFWNFDSDPQPQYDLLDPEKNSHGTRCAGIIGAAANNSICAVGVAFNAQLGGIRMFSLLGELDSLMADDAIEGQSLSYKNQYIDIYSASWGTGDDGKTVDAPGELAYSALQSGIKKGRSGLGSIYIFSAGNGGLFFDNCNCNGFVNSIYTIAISSVSQYGNIPPYAEQCSSILASTYSSGSMAEKN